GAQPPLRLRPSRRGRAGGEHPPDGDRAGRQAAVPASGGERRRVGADARRPLRRRVAGGAGSPPGRALVRRLVRRPGARGVSGGAVWRASGVEGVARRRRRARAGAVVRRATLDHATSLDPVTLSVFVSALAGIAEEMGAVLVRSSYSSNIKERRDCSCALFDEQGRMVAQAEHIPVHLGAMYDSVAAVRERDPEPGDVFVLNDPYAGGTHLPDVTLVTPVSVGDEIVGYTVSRPHHSDVGGMTPGSMPSESRSIFQEGIVIPPIRLVRRGRLVDDVLELVLANVRTPDIRRVDLLAQAAANAVGAERLRALVERHGLAFVRSAFD